MPSSNLTEFRSILRRSKCIVAVAGAGLSAASGIPTFRGAGGLWRSYDALSLATPEAFKVNPSRVWQFYHMRREKARQAVPNAAHTALAMLSDPEFLKSIAPHAKFALITQNVDGLSTRVPATNGTSQKDITSKIFEMHGRLFDTICTECGDRKANFDTPICPSLAGTEHIVEEHQKEPKIPLKDLPHCCNCHGLLRPGVVWFGEIPLQLSEIDCLVEEADIGLIIGTSSTVYPAAGFAAKIAARGGIVAVFNLDRSEGDEEANFLFLGPCEETLPGVLYEGLHNNQPL